MIFGDPDWRNAPFIGARGEVVKDESNGHVFTNGEVQLIALQEATELVQYHLEHPEKTPEFEEVTKFDNDAQLSAYIKFRLPKIPYVCGYEVFWTLNAIRVYYEDREGDY